MRHYPQITRQEAWDHLPLIQAHAYVAAAIQANPTAPVEFTADAYIAQAAKSEIRPIRQIRPILACLPFFIFHFSFFIS